MQQEEIDALEAEFERVKNALHRIDGHTGSGPAQQAYTRAYQKLVKANLRMQIKEKYRGG